MQTKAELLGQNMVSGHGASLDPAWEVFEGTLNKDRQLPHQLATGGCWFSGMS